MYAVLDIGGTNIRIGFFNTLSRPRLLNKKVLPALNDYWRDLSNIRRSINGYWPGKIKKIGVAVAGRLRPDKQGLVSSSNLSTWENRPLVKDLSRLFDCPVVVENDAVAGALGQAVFGQSKQGDFLFIVWGSGIGGAEARHIGGQVKVFGFEPGKQIIAFNGDLTDWEGLCSGLGLRKFYRKPAENLSEKEWRRVCGHFASGLANLLVIRPSVKLVAGGGVALGQFKRMPLIMRLLKNYIKPFYIPKRVSLPRFKSNAGLYGALALLKHQNHE